jgi:hypothetical protein
MEALYFNCKNVSGTCTAGGNTAVWSHAGLTDTTANANITGANNTFIGSFSGPGTSAEVDNATAIGANALVSASNALVLGGTGAYAVNVGIGTATHHVERVGAGGEAVVQLPDWFETLNADFRYQLTAIGAPGPNLYIAQEVQGNSFRLAGGSPGMKVS